METRLFTSSSYALLLLRSAQQPAETLLAGTGLTESDLHARDYIGFEQMAILTRNFDANSQEPAWAARLGSQLNISTHGPMGFAALSAPTLGAALQVIAEFYPVRAATWSIELQQVENYHRLAMTDLTGDERYARWLMEVNIKIVECLIETIVGHPVGSNVIINFTSPAPSYAKTLEEIYGTPCRFDADCTAISIPVSWRHIRSPLYDESTYRTNISKCREILAARRHGNDPVQWVRNILACHFDRVRAEPGEIEAPPSLEAIAAHLYLTPWTLIRRLKSKHTSYKQLLEQTRISFAEELLQQASLTVADVGERLGYRDPANFGRAFRNWKGVTPAAWRRGQRSGPRV